MTHIFVDEVHERALETDIVITLLREITEKRKDLKVGKWRGYLCQFIADPVMTHQLLHVFCT